MATSTLAAWIWSLMLFLVPAKSYDNAVSPPWLREPTAAYEARLKEMAEVIVHVVLDEAEAPVAPVSHPRAFSAFALAFVGAKESGYARDTYHGHEGKPECYRGPGQEARCDHGRSVSPYQVMVWADKTPEGWTKADLFADFEKATRVAIHRLRQSVAAAHRCGLGRAGWLNVYGGGQCTTGAEQGAQRIAKMFELFGRAKWKGVEPVVSEKMLARFEAAGPRAPVVLVTEPPAPVGGWRWTRARCALDDDAIPANGLGPICLR